MAEDRSRLERPQGKRWYFFIWDEDNINYLFAHRIDPGEAGQVFFNRYVITPNKKKHGPRKYRIDGRTDDVSSIAAGRFLERLQCLPKNSAVQVQR